MPTLVCVPIMLEFPARDPDAEPGSAPEPEQGLGGAVDDALADTEAAKAKGADLVEFRIDAVFEGGSGDDQTDAYTVAELRRLLVESALPVILTCRPTWEGGEYDGDDSDRVALFEKLCCGTDSPPAYLDVELAAYTRSANLRQKINLCVTHPKQQRQDVSTRLILSTHDFEGRPADLDRKLLAAYDEPACAVVKAAYRARSLRDNLDLFEIIRESPKPIIALGMGEFGLMSRVLAPKFGGFLTFASLRDEVATAPGQPTIDDLLGMYRFRTIGKATKLYGVIGWPVGHSLSPLIHNAGFAEIGWDGVYLPLPIAADEKDAEASRISFKSTVDELWFSRSLEFYGASVTIPHKERLAEYATDFIGVPPEIIGASNTLLRNTAYPFSTADDVACNTDAPAIGDLLAESLGRVSGNTIGIVGAGGVARAAGFGVTERCGNATVFYRTKVRAESIAADLNGRHGNAESGGSAFMGEVKTADLHELAESKCHAYINCTPVGMSGGPDPEGLSIPIPDMTNIGPDTVFFDTVYNPVETPMLKAARERGCKTIDGVEMFVKQAAAQFVLWTGTPAPVELFDRLCREKLSTD